MNNVIEEVKKILLQKDLDEETKGNQIIEYYNDLDEEAQRDNLFELQKLFDKMEFKDIDIIFLLCNSKIQVQKENAIKVISQIIDPNLSQNMTDRILNICDDDLLFFEKDNEENYKLKYIEYTFDSLDGNVKKEIFNEVFKLVLEAYENTNNEIINCFKIKTLINLFSTMEEDFKKEKFEYCCSLIIDYNGISLDESVDIISKLLNKLDNESRIEKIGQIIKDVSNKEVFKHQMSVFIINLWIEIDDEFRIECFRNVINQIYEIKMDDSNKKVLIEKLFDKIDKKILVENIDFFIEQVHCINNGFDKSNIYINLLDMFDENLELKDKYTYIIMEKLSEEKNDRFDLSSKESFEKSIIPQYLSEDEIWKWDKYNRAKKDRILNYIKQMLKEENINLLDSKPLCTFYDAITHNIIKLSKNEYEVVEEYNKKIEQLKNSNKLQEFNQIIEDNCEMPQDNIKDFLKEVKIYRLRNGRIPKKYYDYIIKETILGNIDKAECEDVIKYCLIDMENDNLERVGIKGYAMGFCSTEENTRGGHLKGRIIMSQADFDKNGLDSIVKIFRHEGRHAEQYKKMYENRFDFNLYKMLRENIIMENDMMFYQDNYFDIEIEFDARMYACMKTYEYLLEIGIPVEKIAEMEDSNMLKEISANFEQNRNIKKFRGKDDTVNSIFIRSFSEGISENRYLDREFNKDCLIKYPILQIEFEYDDNGKILRKSNERIREELNEKLKTISDEEERKKVIAFYEKIFEEQESCKTAEVETCKADYSYYTDFLEKNGYCISDEVRKGLIYEFSKKCYESFSPIERNEAVKLISNESQRGNISERGERVDG